MKQLCSCVNSGLEQDAVRNTMSWKQSGTQLKHFLLE